MKENILAVLASLVFVGTISATAVYAEDTEMTKCQADMSRSSCQTLIKQAKANLAHPNTAGTEVR